MLAGFDFCTREREIREIRYREKRRGKALQLSDRDHDFPSFSSLERMVCTCLLTNRFVNFLSYHPHLFDHFRIYRDDRIESKLFRGTGVAIFTSPIWFENTYGKNGRENTTFPPCNRVETFQLRSWNHFHPEWRGDDRKLTCAIIFFFLDKNNRIGTIEARVDDIIIKNLEL